MKAGHVTVISSLQDVATCLGKFSKRGSNRDTVYCILGSKPWRIRISGNRIWRSFFSREWILEGIFEVLKILHWRLMYSDLTGEVRSHRCLKISPEAQTSLNTSMGISAFSLSLFRHFSEDMVYLFIFVYLVFVSK